ncbi:MAG: DinB family protein [Cyclobacteriaceae bacterium]
MKNWTTQIDQITEQVLDSFDSLNTEELNWKPTADTWSIGQNLDHLMVINKTYFPILKDVRSGNHKAPFLAKISFVVSFLGKTILKASGADRKKKIKTFPIWEPSESHIAPDILERFSKHQTELKLEIERSHASIENGAIISSPANKNIVYTLETAFDIIVAHEQRHIEQSKETLELLRSAMITR